MGHAAILKNAAGEADFDEWIEDARIDAMVRSATGTLPSAISAFSGWAAFADDILGARGDHLPPSEQGLAAWSQCLRNARTLSNYAGYLRMGSTLLDLDTSGTYGPLVKRAKMAVRKTEAPPPERRAIKADLLRRLVGSATVRGDEKFAMLFLCAYNFLLKVPSEGLPLTVGVDPGGPLGQAHSCAAVVNGELVLRLARRENKQHGSTLRRRCSCPASQWMCPVHTLGEWLGRHPAGARPFVDLSPARVRTLLREILGGLHVDSPERHNLHDFRRGHAQDLKAAGGHLKTILDAGEWSSPAFLAYLEREELEAEVVLQAHLDDSEDDDA